MNEQKTMYGRIPCPIYLDQKLFEKLETQRGRLSRNAFINNILENALKGD